MIGNCIICQYYFDGIVLWDGKEEDRGEEKHKQKQKN